MLNGFDNPSCTSADKNKALKTHKARSCVNNFKVNKYDKYFQICSPDLKPIKIVIVDDLSETSRGDG